MMQFYIIQNMLQALRTSQKYVASYFPQISRRRIATTEFGANTVRE